MQFSHSLAAREQRDRDLGRVWQKPPRIASDPPTIVNQGAPWRVSTATPSIPIKNGNCAIANASSETSAMVGGCLLGVDVTDIRCQRGATREIAALNTGLGLAPGKATSTSDSARSGSTPRCRTAYAAAAVGVRLYASTQ